MTLSGEQISRIQRTIESSPITRAVMRENLVDHLCCIVEELLQQGICFEEAFDRALGEIAPNGFKEIEQETHLLLNPKIVFMKKFTYAFAFISCVAFCNGILSKTLHLFGANASLGFGLIGMSIALPLMMMKPNMTGMDRSRVSFAFVSLTLISIGTIFKILHFAGANLSLALGTGLFALGFLPLLFVKMYRESIAS